MQTYVKLLGQSLAAQRPELLNAGLQEPFWDLRVDKEEAEVKEPDEKSVKPTSDLPTGDPGESFCLFWTYHSLFCKLMSVECNEGQGLNKCWAPSGISEVTLWIWCL